MTTTDTTTETVELTNGLLQALLNVTGGDPDDLSPRMRHLAIALHDLRWNMGNRWVVELTEDDIHAVRQAIVAYNEGRERPQLIRHHNYLRKTSETYRRLYSLKENRA